MFDDSVRMNFNWYLNSILKAGVDSWQIVYQLHMQPSLFRVLMPGVNPPWLFLEEGVINKIMVT